jgi:hypothetical protein
MADESGFLITWDEEAGIVRTDWLPGAVCGIDEAREVHEQIMALGQSKPLSLVDLREVGSIDRPAREFFMNSNADYGAVALLAVSAPTRMLANFFLGLKRGEIPVRMFTSEPEAMDWLRGQ